MTSILVRRTGAFGDVIDTTPVVRRLRHENPDAEIDVNTQYPRVSLNSPHRVGLKRDIAYDRVIDLNMAFERNLRRLADRVQGRGEIRLLLPADTWIDFEAADDAIHRAESAIAQGRWARAWGPSLVALFTARRGLLRGEDLPWIEPHRRRLDDIHCSALECYSASALGLAGGELPVGERTARELIEHAPYRESGYRLLMEILAARGNFAEALRVYEELRTLLREELGATPSPPVQALHVQLLKQADGV